MKAVLNLFLFHLIWIPVNSLACMGEETYVDLSKSKGRVTATADSVVIRHLVPLEFKTDMAVGIEHRRNKQIGGLFLYDVHRKSPDKTSGEIIASEKFGEKSKFNIQLTILPQKRGGCSKGEVKYE